MIRKTIKTLEEMSDEEMFIPGVTIPDLQRRARAGENKARLFCELASLSKRFINEGVAFEELLSLPGVNNLSAAMYALQWSDIYYAAVEEGRRKRKRGYWHCLWDAVCGR
jgi:hypothetical protein